jgi:hypothetical protein
MVGGTPPPEPPESPDPPDPPEPSPPPDTPPGSPVVMISPYAAPTLTLRPRDSKRSWRSLRAEASGTATRNEAQRCFRLGFTVLSPTSCPDAHASTRTRAGRFERLALVENQALASVTHSPGPRAMSASATCATRPGRGALMKSGPSGRCSCVSSSSIAAEALSAAVVVQLDSTSEVGRKASLRASAGAADAPMAAVAATANAMLRQPPMRRVVEAGPGISIAHWESGARTWAGSGSMPPGRTCGPRGWTFVRAGAWRPHDAWRRLGRP